MAPRTLAVGAAVTAGLAAMAAGPTESGLDRGGGIYSYVPAPDAAACAIACARDQICLAWSFTATEHVGCALKAIVPPASAASAIQSGLSHRAAAFLALTSLAAPAPPPAEAAEPPPAPPAPQGPSDLGAVPSELEGGPAQIDTVTIDRLAEAAPLDTIFAAPLPLRADIPFSAPILAEPEMLEPPAHARFAAETPLPAFAAPDLPHIAALAAPAAVIAAPELIETPNHERLAALAALETLTPRALPQSAAVTWRSPHIEEPALLADSTVALAALSPLPAASAASLGESATLDWSIPLLIEPETFGAPAMDLAAFAPSGGGAATPLAGAVPLGDAPPAHLIDDTIAPLDLPAFAAAAPLARAAFAPLAERASIAFREPPVIYGADDQAAPTQLALFTPGDRPIPPAPAAEAFLVAASETTLEEPLLGGPDTP